jgi:hypothetical protein
VFAIAANHLDSSKVKNASGKASEKPLWKPDRESAESR